VRARDSWVVFRKYIVSKFIKKNFKKSMCYFFSAGNNYTVKKK
jgi:hypothetical protein